MEIDYKWIDKAVQIIRDGFVSKLEKNGILIYKCGTIIRIDIKELKGE